MSKNLKVLGIGVLLISLAVAGWFLVVGQLQKTVEKIHGSMESQDIKQSIKSEEQKRVQEQKKEKDLGWYEIPELGIKFKVTPEMKDDLIYKKVNGAVYLCSKYVLDFLNNNANFSFDILNGRINYEKYIEEYAQGYIYITSKKKIEQARKKKDKACGDTQIVGFINQKELICFIGRQDPVIPANLIKEYVQTAGQLKQSMIKDVVGNNLQEIKE
jgi:hypothetical protein